MKHVLIVDDEPTICWGLQQLLAEEGCEVSVTSSAETGLKLARARRPDAVVLDVRLPGMDGLSAVEHFRDVAGDVPIVLMTAFGSLDTAVRAIAAGVVEYLPKPFDLDQAAELIHRLLASSERATPAAASVESAEARPAPLDSDALLGTSRPMQEIFKQIALAAGSDVPVLITGESGTGKELIARAIHRHSRRAEGPFLPVSLAALSPAIVESELFGHVRGAFTGAEGDRAGAFELADGGTVLLDEIGDVPPELQVKLLRTIERKELQRVGDARPRPADFRVISATHRDLPGLMAAGGFREDLYYRLGVFQIRAPALRDRPDDIPALAEHFLRRAQQSGGTAGGCAAERSAVEGLAVRPLSFSAAAIRELMSREWRGNVRELRNAVEHAAAVTRGGEIGPEAFPRPLANEEPAASVASALQAATRRWAAATLAMEKGADASRLPLHERLLQLVEPMLLRETLAALGGNRAATAERLGMHRATLRQKLRRYGIDGAADDSTT